ncbi:DUF4860 domain-containing protein [Faecalispora anaeroviscerum]|uniref:DUF4860 domain-containing protein n=1 Tax=Faecalispora anaeroviscerum TaxID=2991836 RepID=UPI0024BA1F41|nr:DUF4860 domain-containing protein [Faecalispora anaeroviscerum]
MNEKTHQSTQTFFALLIACVFTAASLFLVTLGADAYRNSLHSITVNHQIRAALSYTANQIRSADNADNISIESLDNQQVLLIRSQETEKSGNTYLYFRDGYLMELFAGDQDPFEPEYGEKITQINQFAVTKSGKLFVISATAQNGRQFSVSVCPRAS